MGCGTSTPAKPLPLEPEVAQARVDGPAPAPAISTPMGKEPASGSSNLKQESFDVSEFMPASAKQKMAEEKAAEEGQALKTAPSGRDHNLPKDINVVFLLGGPGSGKGTQSTKVVAKYGYCHLSSGDLLRKEVAEGTHLGKLAEKVMAAGELIPSPVVVGIVRGGMTKAWMDTGAKNFLIDGFPRAVDQVKAFQDKVCAPSKVIVLDCPRETMEARCLGREGDRLDDAREVVIKRFNVHMEESVPVIQKYALEGKAFKISTVPPAEDVFHEVCKVLDGFAQPLQPTVEFDKSMERSMDGWEVVFVIGGPGSGKGTACTKLTEEFGWVHLSAGDVLRTEVSENTPTGIMCAKLIGEGQLVPVHVVTGLMKIAMHKSSGSKFLIDGYPRNVEQSEAFEQDVLAPDAVVYFDCPAEVAEARVVKRGIVSDTPEVVRNRIQVFHDEGMPVVDHYKRVGKLKVVDASKDKDEAYAQVEALFKEFDSSKEHHHEPTFVGDESVDKIAGGGGAAAAAAAAAPAAPEVPSVPEVAAPEAPAMPEAPAVPDVAAAVEGALPDAPEAPAMPEAPEVPDVAAAAADALPDAPEVPAVPDVAEAAADALPDAPAAPEAPAMPEAPAVPDVAEAAGDAAEAAAGAAADAVPDAPAAPEAPAVPDVAEAAGDATEAAAEAAGDAAAEAAPAAEAAAEGAVEEAAAAAGEAPAEVEDVNEAA